MDTADQILNETSPAILAGHLSQDPAGEDQKTAMDTLVRRSMVVAGICALILIAGVIAFATGDTATDMLASTASPPSKVLPIP